MKNPTDRRTFLAQGAGALAAVALAPDFIAAAPRRRGRASKVALIGAGRRGREILDELRKLEAVEVGAICDIVPARVASGIERAPGAAGFAEHAALLERADIEAVIVATPTHLHRDIVVDALAAGKHVYCEAPIAHSPDDCDAIVAAATDAGGVFHAGFQARSNPLYRRALLAVRSDGVREMISLYAQHHRKTSWRFPSAEGQPGRAANWRQDPLVSLGLAGELGSHQFDVFSWFRGREPEQVSGTGSVRFHDDGRRVYDTARAELVWDDGIALHWQATLGNSYGGEHEIVYGSNAAVKLAGTHGWLFKEADSPTQGWEVYATRQQFHRDEGIVLVADATQLAAQGRLKEGGGLEHPPLYFALADFVRSFLEGEEVACTAEQGAAATRVGIRVAEAIGHAPEADPQ